MTRGREKLRKEVSLKLVNDILALTVAHTAAAGSGLCFGSCFSVRIHRHDVCLQQTVFTVSLELFHHPE